MNREQTSDFTGREDLLTRLHGLLHAGKATALTQPQAISGLGDVIELRRLRLRESGGRYFADAVVAVASA